MTGKQLRDSILQEAIQGRLVPQDPADEPASVLLKRIREEKKRLIKEKKIKKPKTESTIFCGEDGSWYEKYSDGKTACIDEEIPFEIPMGWVWVRLENCINLTSGRDLEPSQYNDSKKGIPYMTGASNFINNNLVINRWTEYPITVSHLGDLLITCKGTIGALAFNRIGDIHIARQIMSIEAHEYILGYLRYYLELNVPHLEKQANSMIPGISREVLLNALIPLPPLSEQRRIVAKIEEVMPYVERYRESKRSLDFLNSSLKAQIKKSVLQEAIQGRLVPQDPADEPASELLKKIREEKKRLVKEKKIKKPKNESLIFRGEDGSWYEKYSDGKTVCIDEEIPFELPQGWEWVRLGEITTKLIDGNHNPPKGVEYITECKMLSSRNINDDKIVNLGSVRYLDKDTFELENRRTDLQKGDILFTSVASIGRSCVFDGKGYFCFQRSVTILKTETYNFYIKYLFDSPYYQNIIIEKSTGTAQRGFYLEQMSKSLIPLPPLSEQRRIVAKIEEVLGALG